MKTISRLNKMIYTFSSFALMFHSVLCFLKYVGFLNYFSWESTTGITIALGFLSFFTLLVPIVLSAITVYKEKSTVKKTL